MTTVLGWTVADFSTQLTTKIAVGGETATLLSTIDDDGVQIATGRYFITIDGGNSNKEHFSCTLTGNNLTALKSISRQGVETSGAVREHRVGATVSMTDFAHLKYITDLVTGTTKLDGTKPLEYDSAPTLVRDHQVCTKKYIDDLALAGAGKASNTVYGLVKLSEAADDPTEPIACGTNDDRLPSAAQVGYIPTSDEKGALDGTGTPSASNKFVTEDTIANFSNSKETLNAGETIDGATLPVPVYQNPTDNEIYKCDADDSTKLEFLGFAISNGTDGNPISVQTAGIVPGFTGLAEGTRYYLQDTAGTIGTSKGTYAILVGIAISETQLLIMKEDRPDERWIEQAISDLSTDSITYYYDFAFDEKRENLYLVYAVGTSPAVVYITRFKKDRRTGKFVQEANATVAGNNDGPCGVTVYLEKVYVSSYYSGAQHVDRYDLDLANKISITISGGSANEKGVMTNVGSTFYILDTDTHTTIGIYTLSGTTFTRTGGITVSGIDTYPARSLSTDGTYLYLAYNSASAINFATMGIKRASISGGAFSSVTKFGSASSIAGLIPYDGTEFVAIYALSCSYNTARPMWQLAKVYL